MKRSQPSAQGSKTLQPLPWAPDALAPTISARTIEFHYGKHHKGYVDKLNELIYGTPLTELSLEEIVRETQQQASRVEIYRNAAQAWNHDFYWRSLTPESGKPPADLLRRIERSFGAFDALKQRLADAAVKQFGAGWAWLVEDGETLRVMQTEDADNPLTSSSNPLLTVDVWEHAYYLDYQNDRAKHVEAVIDRLMNWEEAQRRSSL